MAIRGAVARPTPYGSRTTRVFSLFDPLLRDQEAGWGRDWYGWHVSGTDDATLLQQWKNGDKRSGEELFSRYYELVSRFFANKTSVDKADLVQKTFMACLEKVDGLRNAASFRSFLFGVARFELLHHYRRKHQRETDFDGEQVSVCDLDPSPSRIVAKQQEERLLLEALRRIPIELQIILELSYWEQLTGAEIAEVVGVPVGTVKSRVRRAREQLDIQMRELAASTQVLQSTAANLDQWAARLRNAAAVP